MGREFVYKGIIPMNGGELEAGQGDYPSAYGPGGRLSKQDEPNSNPYGTQDEGHYDPASGFSKEIYEDGK